MGIALLATIAAKLANSDKRVIAVTGDGGFLMNSQALEMAVRIGTSLVTLIFIDRHYGLMNGNR